MKHTLKGFKTYSVMTVVIMLTILDEIGTIDLKSLMLALGVPEGIASAAPALVAVLAILLRTITTTPPAGLGKSS